MRAQLMRSLPLAMAAMFVALLLGHPAAAQWIDESPASSMWMGVMIMGGFLMMAAIGVLVALAVFFLRKSRTYPRHAHRV